MGLYQLKEFLTLDDVADYLRDKGVYDFDLSNSYDQNRLTDFIEQKIQPIYSISGYFNIEIVKMHATAEQGVTIDTIGEIKEVFLDAYFKSERLENHSNYSIIKYKNDMTIDLLSMQVLNFGFDAQDAYVLVTTGKVGGINPIYFLDFQPIKKFQNINEQFVTRLKIDGYYPKSELDALFNAKDDSQQQIADLQAENAHLKAQIAELESQLNQANTTPTNDDVELTGTSKKAVTKLLYALLREHKYNLNGTIKGAINSTLENLTEQHGVPVARDTLGKWLDEINALHCKKTK